MNSRARVFVTLCVAMAGTAGAQDINGAAPVPRSADTVPLSYVGSNARIGLNVDQDGDVQGEALGVLGYNGARAFLMEGWLGDGGAGGLQAGYHWLWGGRTREDTIQHPAAVTVTKFFVAADRNAFGDRKGSIGLGLERAAFGLDLYYSRALTDERLVNSSSVSVTETVFGDENGRPFQQQITIHTLIEQFEHPYDQGLGFRLAHFFERPLLRLHGGLDFERGATLLQGQKAEQRSVTLGLEKHFEASPHSVGLEIEHFSKEGPFDRSTFGGERGGTRAALQWHYEFGRSFRPLQDYRDREIVHTVQSAPPPAPEIYRTELQLSSEALFELNRAEVTAAARATLRDLVSQIKSRRAGPIEIVGHTCDLASDEYNQGLSERRAAAVRGWLIAEGVPADALQASGRGEREPKYPNDSEENRARNRRITLSFMAAEEKRVTKQQVTPQTTIEHVREAVPTPAAWIERALRTPSVHKRAVDTYRIQRVTPTRFEGERVLINRAPQAVDDAATTTRDIAVTIATLANDSDPDGDALQLASVETPSHGSAVANDDGTVTYTPTANFVGTDNVTYTIRDADGLTATATVTVTVARGENRPPVAEDDLATPPRDGAGTLLIDVLRNDHDPDDDPLVITITRGPRPGTITGLSIIEDNQGLKILATFSEGPTTADFEYTVTDPGGLSDTATVRIVPQ